MKTIYTIAVVLLLLSCKGNTEVDVQIAPTHQNQKSSDANKDKDLNRTASVSEVAFNDQLYDKVYEEYLNVKGALVNTNPVYAQENAMLLSKSLDGISNVSDTTRKAVKTIISESNVAKQRAAFEIISQDLEVLLSKNVTSGTIYKQYCPMAFNGKGAYWLSNSKEVRNPYYGDKMLTCGVVDSEIE